LDLEYERLHLLKKLSKRDKKKHAQLKREKKLKSHPIIKTRKGEVEEWEKV
jgi:hypothetical protein